MPEPRATSQPYPHGALPIGTRLGEFEIRRVLGVGGFGIVYLAFDHLLEREVALKEYMPSALADRKETMHVSLISQANADTFALGLRSFVNEARLLARFDHPSLVKVHRFWEANGTAYMAMALYKGRTVRDVRLEMSGQPDEAWVRRILEPLLGAVEKLHSEDIYHRDIAPDNILIEADGRPVLLDFGAARRVISDRSQALTAILKPSYAPIEQYADVGGMKQGAWTDIYALGATMHFLLLGRPPPPAPGRSIQDTMPSLASQNLLGCSREFLELIDWMLTPMPTERPQSVAAVRDVLAGRTQPPRKGQSSAPARDPEQTLPLGARAMGQDSSTMVVPRGQTGYSHGSDEATVIVPRSGNTGYNPSTRAMPPAPPPPPVADEDATVVTAYPAGYRTQRPPTPASPPPPPPAPPPPTSRMAPEPTRAPQPAAARTGVTGAAHTANSANSANSAKTQQPSATVPPPAPPRSPLLPLVAGVLVAVLLGAGLWWFLTRPVSTGLPVAPPASAAATTPVPTPVPTPPTPTPPTPTPTPPPTPTPTPEPAQPAVTSMPTPPPPADPKPQAPTATTPARPPAATTTRPAPPRPADAYPTARPPEPTPPRPSTVPDTSPATPVPAPPTTATAPAPAPEVRANSPSERCAKELPLVRLICIDLACNRAEFTKHPECLKLRADQASRRNFEGN